MLYARSKDIYDYVAITPVEERGLDGMVRYLRDLYGNAASRTHRFGQQAAEAVEGARATVAAMIGAAAKEIIWTSGATEADNLAILGAVRAAGRPASHVITQASEHPAVLDSVRELQQQSVSVTVLPIDRAGVVQLDALHKAIRADTVLVTVMAANNETGVIQPVREIGKICRAAGVLFHCDAAQAVGKIPLDVDADNIDLLSISAHKLYGPKGVGALYVRSKNPRVKLHPIIHGGGHERGMRSGTINVPGVIGLGKACEIAGQQMAADAERLGRLRDQLEQGIMQALDGVAVNGAIDRRLPHVTNLRFDGIEAEALLMAMDDVAASTGAACSSMKMEPSHVLMAMGLTEQQAFSSVRFSLGRGNTEAEVEHVIRRVTETVESLRRLNVSL